MENELVCASCGCALDEHDVDANIASCGVFKCICCDCWTGDDCG